MALCCAACGGESTPTVFVPTPGDEDWQLPTPSVLPTGVAFIEQRQYMAAAPAQYASTFRLAIEAGYTAGLTIATYDDAAMAADTFQNPAENKGVLILIGVAAAATPVEIPSQYSGDVLCFIDATDDPDGPTRECAARSGRHIVATGVAPGDKPSLPPIEFDLELLNAGLEYVDTID